MTSPTIKSCNQDLNPDLFHFLDEHLPFKYDKSVFDWEYGHADKVFCYLESGEGKVLGAQGMIPVQLDFGSKILRTAKSETSYLAKEAQGQGLFSKLYKKAIENTHEKGLELIWGFTSLGPVWKRLGFTVQNDCLLNCEIQIRPSALPSDKFKARRWLGYGKSALLAMKTARCNRQIAASQPELTYSESPVSTKDIQSLHKEIKKNHPDMVSLDLNEDYFSQRISNNPFIDYVFGSMADTEGKMRGYYIMATKPGTESVYLSDVTAVNKDIKLQLIAKAISRAKGFKSCRSLKLFGNKFNPLMCETFNLINRFGTRKMDSGMYLVVRPLSEEQQSVEHDFSTWYINGLWTEGITQ